MSRKVRLSNAGKTTAICVPTLLAAAFSLAYFYPGEDQSPREIDHELNASITLLQKTIREAPPLHYGPAPRAQP